LLNSQINNNKLKGKYLSCPYCGFKHIKPVKETDNLRECMDHSSYKKVNGAIRQVRHE
jgi:DNA-directed RNA polymerase subunit RPC12/RpoP